MKVSTLVSALSELIAMGAGVCSGDTPVTGVENDSRNIGSGNIFVAVKGFEVDGHQFVKSAFKCGAVVAIIESVEEVDSEVRDRCIIVKNSRKALAEIACEFYGNPTRDLKLIGITGTNGKTSTAHLIYEFLRRSRKNVAIMSTIETRYQDFQKDMDHTTKESHEIQRFAKEIVEQGAEYLVLEVSSHAISLFRTFGCYFDQMIFTNFDIDHQDFYGGVDSYFEAKAELFTSYPNLFPKKDSLTILNVDDPKVRVIADRYKTDRIVTFGLEESGEYSGSALQVTDAGIAGEVVGRGHSVIVESPLTTSFNRYNLLAAIVSTLELGCKESAIESAVREVEQIRGRLTEVKSNLPFRVFIDFAHSGTGLFSVLKALREIAQARIIVVFGAGGEKDPLRREEMGKAAATLAEIAIITCDNPRRESPKEIINSIVHSWRKAVRLNQLEREMLVEADRSLAIRKAIEWAEPRDIVCIAGKGHERGQIIGTEVFDFDDYEVAENYIREAENAQGLRDC